MQVDKIKKSDDSHNKGSALTTFMHIVCVSIGAGVFNLPKGIHNAGWISLVFVLLVGVLSYYSGILVISNLYPKNSDSCCHSTTRLSSLAASANAAFGRPGYVFVQISYYLVIFGVSWVYIILSGQNIHEVVELTKSTIDLRIWYFLIGILIAIPFVCVKSIKEATWLSIFGMSSTAVAIVVTVVYSFISISRSKGDISGIKLWDRREIPNLLTKLVFAYSASYLYPHIESTMSNKTKWKTSLLSSMSFIFFCYLTVSVSGMVGFKDNVKAPIYANLDSKSPAVIMILILMVIHFLFATPIFLCTIALDIEEKLEINRRKYTNLKEFLLRACVRLPIMLALTILSVTVDDYEFASDLIGAIPKTSLVILMPCFCFLKLNGIKGHSIKKYVLLTLLLALGFICSIYGTYDAFANFYKRRNSK